MTLQLYSFQPDLGRLMRLAARERLLPPGGDLGYAIHAALAATFGEHAPKPWVLLAPGQGGGRAGRLLAYGSASLEVLRAHAATFSDPAFAAPLALEHAEERPMPPSFRAGTRLGFRVRVRPVARTGKPIPGHPSALERGERGRERDVYLSRVAAADRIAVRAAVDAGEMTTADDPSAEGVRVPTRAACYVEWLDARLRDAGASIPRVMAGTSAEAGHAARVDAFQFTRVMTRDRRGGSSRSQHPNGPDATISGTLVVEDPEKFAYGLARGIGRFRAFGFGMLLLTPPRS